MVNLQVRRRIPWIAALSVGLLLLVAAVGWRFWISRYVAQWQLLQHVSQSDIEGVDEQTVQVLGWNLAILGRDDEVRQLDFHPQFDRPPLEIDTDGLEVNVVPWKDGIKQIAANHRIVMIMEDHSVSRHREMIGATLPVFRDAGFTHYAAEAIGESSSSLRSRGYPAVQTGYYTSDPKFGNVLRKALDLSFHVLGYDYRPFTHKGREEFAAGELARLFETDSRTRLVVHAGFAHVLKHKTDIGQKWLASLLWEKSGIEPFTIWQWSAMRDGHEYRVVAKAVADKGSFDEPVLLMPPPTTNSGLRNVPRVDAILVHPPDQSVAPNERTVLFPDEMRRVSGQWLTKQWPVVVAAYTNGEPVTAIPLDQVMLRDSEQNFTLWIPDSMEFEIVVFDQNGILDAITEEGSEALRIRRK